MEQALKEQEAKRTLIDARLAQWDGGMPAFIDYLRMKSIRIQGKYGLVLLMLLARRRAEQDWSASAIRAELDSVDTLEALHAAVNKSALTE